ncbi:hypothetical protein BD779DRAFT_1566980 [Infundibulicybe gibba]|nr:hypothetical protein BD779DRAFT_1566980 [Infundibulicybe gibba]
MNDDVFNFIIGVLALVSAITSIFGYYHSCLPSQRMEKFDKIFGHSKKLFSQARENGLITTSITITNHSPSYYRLEASSLEARSRVYVFSQGPGVYVINPTRSPDIRTTTVAAAEPLGGPARKRS